jgi:hypothetical protein
MRVYGSVHLPFHFISTPQLTNSTGNVLPIQLSKIFSPSQLHPNLTHITTIQPVRDQIPFISHFSQNHSLWRRPRRSRNSYRSPLAWPHYHCLRKSPRTRRSGGRYSNSSQLKPATTLMGLRSVSEGVSDGAGSDSYAALGGWRGHRFDETAARI